VRETVAILSTTLSRPQTGQLLHAQLPSETLCTENLTPFLKLLPCKGISGISGLMKPYVLLAHDWHAMGVDYTSSEDDTETNLVLWWEAVVDLVDWEKEAKRGEWSFITNVDGSLNGISSDFSIHSLFDRDLPRMCPVAQTSEIILAGEEPDLLQLVSGSPSSSSGDGFRVWEYDRSLAGKNLDFRWINESTFIPRKHKYLPMYRLRC
jgi:phosphatidylinositol glycan class T